MCRMTNKKTTLMNASPFFTAFLDTYSSNTYSPYINQHLHTHKHTHTHPTMPPVHEKRANNSIDNLT